ncbi:alpha-amylase family glycosyl hydrolase [Vibrio tasmaniensis]|uniref:alpha-amylase family glycosyl hydrolase n=1 Tax=Vibrio tasmaniensis TaxID=212663 RepID=UPI00111AC12D|nr:alpha-amylase family glycosyl hydrolase [Vibrio tasmaniensis]
MVNNKLNHNNKDLNVKLSLSNTALAVTAILLAGCQSAPESVQVPTAYQCQTNTNADVNDLRIYQVMVESFVSGDDSIGHGTGYGTSHHNGDIQGIIDSLDYIESLGMNGIWLTPIFNSEPIENQDHWADRLDATGYFATDYFNIDPRFGTIEEAKALVEEAHARGLYVFFDGVFGHHKKNVVPSPTGKLPQGQDNPVSYPESLAFYQEVAEYWIKELKIDGWRLDQAYQVPKEAWSQIRETVDTASSQVEYVNSEGKTVNPLGYMVAEIWAGENRIIETGYGSNEAPALCSAFDFPMRYRLTETFAVNEAGVGNKGGEWLAEGMSLHSLYPDHAKPNLMIGNHDLVRFGDLLQRGDIASPQDKEYWQRYKAAFSFQAAYTGPITTYYGDEIGDQLEGFADKVWTDDCAINGLCDDHVARTSGKVEGVTAQLNAHEKDLKQYVTNLMKLRETHPALSQGKRTNLMANDVAYVDHKAYEGDAVVYAVNVTNKEQTIKLTKEKAGSIADLTDIESKQSISEIDGNYSIALKPFEARFLSITQPSKKGPIATIMATGNEVGQGFMAQCDNPTIKAEGPISSPLYVVGNFADSGWKHVDLREFEYKGDNTYQVVTTEKPGSYRMQYASKAWSPQFTADGLNLKLGQLNSLIKGGYGQDTAITIRNAGQYVWSLQFDDAGQPLQIMASKCAE